MKRKGDDAGLGGGEEPPRKHARTERLHEGGLDEEADDDETKKAYEELQKQHSILEWDTVDW